MKLEIFDPPMCCSTGICGEHADSKLVIFASDLEWLKMQGVEVVRYGLSFDPLVFKKNNIVNATINSDGKACLPIILFDGILMSKASYPSREKLAKMCNIKFNSDEAPPVKREENCCCGEDCDCRMPKDDTNTNTIISDSAQDACANAPAEDNCYSVFDCDCKKSFLDKYFRKILFIIAILIILGIVFFRTCCSVGSVELF